jgi:hypothetical protein
MTFKILGTTMDVLVVASQPKRSLMSFAGSDVIAMDEGEVGNKQPTTP